ncbi:MAG: PGPGW domain-containing protein [Gemmatimonadales bacterium]
MSGIRAGLERLIHAEPGNRFRSYYRAHRAEHRSGLSRGLWILGGLLLVAIGIVALPAPGPGTLIIAAGGALLARESGTVARILDGTELALRRGWRAARRLWNKAVS